MTFGPLYITPMEVAEAIGWTKAGDPPEKRQQASRKAARWLRSAGALIERGGKTFTTREKLKAAFPEVWEELEIQAWERDANSE